MNSLNYNKIHCYNNYYVLIINNKPYLLFILIIILFLLIIIIIIIIIIVSHWADFYLGLIGSSQHLMGSQN